jgi:hypothetical protein
MEEPTKLVGQIQTADWVTFIPPVTLRGLVTERADRGLKVDYRSVWAFVQAEKLSFKKTVLASEQDRPDGARRRPQGKKYQPRIDPSRLVFIDETWAKTNLARRCGAGRLAASGSRPRRLSATGTP